MGEEKKIFHFDECVFHHRVQGGGRPYLPFPRRKKKEREREREKGKEKEERGEEARQTRVDTGEEEMPRATSREHGGGGRGKRADNNGGG